jgi:hypothetical protein
VSDSFGFQGRSHIRSASLGYMRCRHVGKKGKQIPALDCVTERGGFLRLRKGSRMFHIWWDWAPDFDWKKMRVYMGVFEKCWVLKRIFGATKEEITARWWGTYSKRLQILYCSPNMGHNEKGRRYSSHGPKGKHVEHFSLKEQKSLPEKPRNWWEGNKVGLK